MQLKTVISTMSLSKEKKMRNDLIDGSENKLISKFDVIKKIIR